MTFNRKVLLSLICILLIATSILPFATNHRVSANSGSGTIGDPYIITDIYGFLIIAYNPSAYFELGNNINASITQTWGSGTGFTAFNFDFSGVLDGKNYSIDGLYQNKDTTGYGIFNIISGTIKNIRFTNISFTSTVYGQISSILCIINNGLISNVYISGNLTSTDSDAAPYAFENYGIIEQSIFEGIVSASDISSPGIASLFVYRNTNTIIDCYAKGSAIGPVTTGFSIVNTLLEKNCYSVATLSGSFNQGFDALSSYYGLGVFTEDYWDTDVSGIYTSDGGVGKTTIEMLNQSTYIGWDFINVWNINSSINSGYPYLNISLYTPNTMPTPTPTPTPTPIGLLGHPENIVITETSDNCFDMSWDLGVNSTSSLMIICKNIVQPCSGTNISNLSSNCIVLYDGSGTSFTGNCGWDLNNYEYTITAWGVSAGGNFSIGCTFVTVGGERMLGVAYFIGLLILALGATIFAFRASGILFRFGAAIAWLNILLYIMDNNHNFSFVSPWCISLFFSIFCMILAILMMYMSREINQYGVLIKKDEDRRSAEQKRQDKYRDNLHAGIRHKKKENK
jgi:hypothetical protein